MLFKKIPRFIFSKNFWSDPDLSYTTKSVELPHTHQWACAENTSQQPLCWEQGWGRYMVLYRALLRRLYSYVCMHTFKNTSIQLSIFFRHSSYVNCITRTMKLILGNPWLWFCSTLYLNSGSNHSCILRISWIRSKHCECRPLS